MKMSLIMIFTFISIILLSYYLLQPSCASSLQTQFQPSQLFQHQQANANHRHLSLPRMVRKLRISEQVKGYSEARDLASSHKKKGYLSGKQHHRKQKMMLKKKETRRQEWVNYGEDPSQYFAKDYNHVGRRRPIHN